MKDKCSFVQRMGLFVMTAITMCTLFPTEKDWFENAYDRNLVNLITHAFEIININQVI